MQRTLLTTLTIALAMLLTLNAHAQNFLEDEAGITAYANTGQAINLTRVRSVFRTIENETTDFIVGSVAVPDYPETEDAHVYVNKDGWIAAYYLADEPVAKIIDWKGYDGTIMATTKLELALQSVADAVGAPLAEVKYYDFTAPQANKLLIVADREDATTTDSFNIQIPNDITVFKRSWSLYTFDSESSGLSINDDEISTLGLRNSDKWDYGELTPNQLRQDLFHTVKISHDDYNNRGWSAGAIVLVYQQP